MTTVEQATEQARLPLLTLVRHRQTFHGSRMAAYEAVGSTLGRSASWVRKVIGRAPDVQVGLHDWLNINAVCARLDAASSRIEAQTAAREEARSAIREASEVSRPVRPRSGSGSPIPHAPLNDTRAR